MALFDPRDEQSIAVELKEWERLTEEIFGCCHRESHLIRAIAARINSPISSRRDKGSLGAAIDELFNYAQVYVIGYQLPGPEDESAAGLVRRVVRTSTLVKNTLS